MLATLYYNQKCMRIPTSPHHYQPIFYYFIYYDRCEVVLFVLFCMSLISVSVHVHIGYIYIYFEEMFIQILCSFFKLGCLFSVFIIFIQCGCYTYNRCRSLILWLLFHFLEHVLRRTTYFISDEIQFIFCLILFCFGGHI